MVISRIQFRPPRSKTKGLLADVQVTLNNALVLDGLQLQRNKFGELLLWYPKWNTGYGRTAYFMPTGKSDRDNLRNEIFAAYEQYLEDPSNPCPRNNEMPPTSFNVTKKFVSVLENWKSPIHRTERNLSGVKARVNVELDNQIYLDNMHLLRTETGELILATPRFGDGLANPGAPVYYFSSGDICKEIMREILPLYESYMRSIQQHWRKIPSWY